MGFVGLEIENLDKCKEDSLTRLLPNAVELVILDEENPTNNKVYEVVKFVNRVGGSTLAAKHEISKSKLIDIKQRMMEAARAEEISSGKSVTPPQVSSHTETPADDSEFDQLGDMPF
jgi:hypothetical protein